MCVCVCVCQAWRFNKQGITAKRLVYVCIRAGIANIGFRQTEDGQVHLLAIPLINGHSKGVVNLTPEAGNSGEGVIGEVEALALSHPIVRLDFFKATDGMGCHKHEETVKEISKTIYTPCKFALYKIFIECALPGFSVSLLASSFHTVCLIHVPPLSLTYLSSPFPVDGVFSNPWSSACMDNVQSTLSHYGPAKLQEMFQG